MGVESKQENISLNCFSESLTCGIICLSFQQMQPMDFSIETHTLSLQFIHPVPSLFSNQHWTGLDIQISKKQSTLRSHPYPHLTTSPSDPQIPTFLSILDPNTATKLQHTTPEHKFLNQPCTTTNNKMQHVASILLSNPTTFPAAPLTRLTAPHYTCSATKSSTVSIPSKPTKPPPNFPSIKHPPNVPTFPSKNEFQEKMLYLDSLGLDFLSLLNDHPPIISSSLSNIQSLVDHLTFLNFTPSELQRIFGMCPQLLTRNRKDISPVLSFLLREVRVSSNDLKRVINRRPRLLVSDVNSQLRPTLYFLLRIGVEDVTRHTHLLSCSVEDKFLPRIDYFERIGFSNRDALFMFRRFPQLFCYSVEGNLEPKFDYFVFHMGRDLNELKEFPQYFSFSLEKRIKPRHQRCVEKGVCFPLPVLLKTSDARFCHRLEVCCSSSMPVRSSPLWCTNCEVH